jgi:uncharacterized protein (DUF58 family)
MRAPLAMLGCAAALVVAAAIAASLALFAVGVGLILLTAAAATVVALASTRVTVAHAISRHEIDEDGRIGLYFHVRRRTWLPVQIEIEDHTGGWMEVRERAARLDLCVARRGPHWLEPSRIRVRDTLGIFERRLMAGRREPLLVLPAAQPLLRDQVRHPATVDEPELHGLAAYTPGTPLTRIHWPAFARGAGLQVRHVAPAQGGVPLVVVDTTGAPSDEAIDWAARVAAGHILTLARHGGCRVLLPADTAETMVAGAEEWRAMHRRLATISSGAPSGAGPLAGDDRVVHVRAAEAPPGTRPAPQLPRGIVPRSP